MPHRAFPRLLPVGAAVVASPDRDDDRPTVKYVRRDAHPAHVTKRHQEVTKPSSKRFPADRGHASTALVPAGESKALSPLRTRARAPRILVSRMKHSYLLGHKPAGAWLDR